MEETKLVIKVENDYAGEPNWVTSNILDCMRFWNGAGQEDIAKMKSNKPGWQPEGEKKMLLETMKPDDFLLEAMLRDCKIYVDCEWSKNSGHTFECGRTRSHVWVHMDDKRIFMFYI